MDTAGIVAMAGVQFARRWRDDRPRSQQRAHDDVAAQVKSSDRGDGVAR
jgi:hypothetical protein